MSLSVRGGGGVRRGLVTARDNAAVGACCQLECGRSLHAVTDRPTPFPRCGTRAATRMPRLVHTTVRPTLSTPARKTRRWPPFRLGGLTVDPLATPTPEVAAATARAATRAIRLIVIVIRHRRDSRHTGED
jgi:hypothetical protein